jgi:hypothetical protein
MQILTLEDTHYHLDDLPDEVDDSMRFAVLDNSDPKNPDFFFQPLIFLESFSSPAMVLKIGNDEVSMPIDWHIAVGDSEGLADVEILPLTSLNDRGFEAFCFNPLSGFRAEFQPVEIVNVYNEVKWYFPKMKNGQLLATPLGEKGKKKPQCAYFIKDISRQCEIIDYGTLI